jgi:AhpD family alkylhydroperoxidase
VSANDGKEITMDARLNLYDNAVATKFAKHINSAGAVVTGSALPAATQELVKIRASQINGCAACTDMHTKDAEHAGESPVRLHLVAAWREANVFTDAERAALELTERAPASPTAPVASPTRPGRTPSSITTRTSSPPWCPSSPSSTPTTG